MNPHRTSWQEIAIATFVAGFIIGLSVMALVALHIAPK